MERFGLRNDQWERIKDVLPGREGHVGGTAEDNRLFVEAILYRFRTGCTGPSDRSRLERGKLGL
jgi:transposase